MFRLAQRNKGYIATNYKFSKSFSKHQKDDTADMPKYLFLLTFIAMTEVMNKLSNVRG